MTTQEPFVDFAVEVPPELAAEVAQHAEAVDGLTVTLKPVDDRPRDPRFEPATLAMMWTVFKLVTDSGLSVALGILSNIIYERMKAQTTQQKAPHFLTIRFGDGTVIEAPLDKPLDTAAIVQIVRRKKR